MGISDAIFINSAISVDSYCPINKVYSFVIFSLGINAVILLLNCLVLILYLYIHFLFLYCSENIPISGDLCTVSLLLDLVVLKTISPTSLVWASLLFFY